MTAQKQAKLKMLLTEAHNSYKELLSSYAYFKISNRTVSEDLVQNTFMKTWMYLMRGGKIQKMKSFLYHVLNNLIVDEYRKHKEASLDVMIEKGFEITTDSKNLSDRLGEEITPRLIKELPEMYKDLIDMRYLQELSTEEISLMTGLSKNLIAVRLHRGLKKLRWCMPAYT